MNLFKLMLLGVIFGCAAHTAPQEPNYTPEIFDLSGSPCVDGLFINIDNRCSYTSAIASEGGDHVTIACAGPNPPRAEDTLYYGYTELAFLVYSNNNLEYFPDDASFFCIDTAVSIGFISE